ncbi:hypothetical protein M408DRAFT_327911 [Serendipita vermifera MAFF 305830]|uniref:NB-ARC domain-containing protein n=1 Tax=Serendipita vermifera MAFF 305830 TaxID=933852 RepID=A0A0C3B2F3_SERVB|nr:hypothetical protein M408DRAFT_327911 [Serendipita vermifera MAFF 305830]
MKLLDPNDRSSGCKLAVPISYKNNAGSQCTLYNFHIRSEPPINMTITEALLATLAMPPLMNPIAVRKDASTYEYISGDLALSNPTRKIIAEAKDAFGSEALVAWVFNIGCGRPGVISTPQGTEVAGWSQFLEMLLKDSERRAEEFQRQVGHLGLFQRLSVAAGLEEASKAALSSPEQVLAYAQGYLDDVSVREKLELCVDALKTRLGISSLEQLNHSGGGFLASPSLPLLAETFVMRDEPWRFIEESILGPQNAEIENQRILVVTGMGGCGKTQLIVKFMHVYQTRFSLRLFIDGSSKSRIRSEIVRNIRSLGSEHSQKTFDDCLIFLAQSSPSGPRLIVYDNVDDPELDILSLLPKGRGCRIIITSRNHAIGEVSRSFHLELDVMSKEESVELLLHPPSGSLDSIEHARKIAEFLGHLPIALTQARSYIYQTRCSQAEYLEILEQSRAELLAEPIKYQRDMRYQSTDAAFDASFKKLAFRDQQLLFLLSFFHWNNWPLHLVVIAAKDSFAGHHFEYTEHGEETYTGKALLESIFLHDSRWSPVKFNQTMLSLQSYSLVTIRPGIDTRLLQMHPLIHTWVQSRIPELERFRYQSAAVLLLVLGARVEHTPLVQYLPSHVTHFYPIWNQLHINNAAAFGHIMQEGGLFKGALSLRERIFTKLRSDIFDKPSDSPMFHVSMSLIETYDSLGQFDKAKAAGEQLLRSTKEIFGERHPDTIRVSSQLGGIYHSLGRLDDALQIEEQVLQLSKEIRGDHHPDIIIASINLALTYHDLGRLKDALQLQEQVLQLSKEIRGDRHPNTINVMGGLATTYNDLGRLSDALQLQEQVLHLRKEILGDRHPDTIGASSDLALTYIDLGRLGDALQLQEQVLRLRKEILGDRHPDTIVASSNLANTYGNLGRLDDALILQEQVLHLRKEILGDRHPDTISASTNLAVVYSNLGRLDDALHLREQVLQLSKEILGENHPDTIVASGNLASTFQNLGRLDDARQLREQVLQLRKEILGDRHPDTINASSYLAITYRTLGRLDDALPLQEQMLQLSKEIRGDRHPDTITASSSLANTYRELGRLDETLQLEEQVLRLRKEILGDHHPDTIGILSNLAITYRELGRLDDALHLKEQALQLSKETLGDRHPDTIGASSDLAVIYTDLGRLEDALPLQKHVLQLRKEILGDRHPDTIDALRDLGMTLKEMGKWDQVIKLQDEVLSTTGELETQDPKVIQAMIDLSIPHREVQILSRSSRLLDDAEVAINETGGDTHPLYPSCQSARALLQDCIDQNKSASYSRPKWARRLLGRLRVRTSSSS